MPGGPRLWGGEVPDAPWEIREMSAEDLPEVLVLEEACFSDPWSEQAFREEIGRGALACNRVLRRGGRVCAYTVAWIVAGEVHLANLAVAPSERRFGLASALVEDLCAEGRRRGASVVWLEVRAGNEAAIRLYKKHGFRQVAVRKNYYARQREDALVMLLELTREEGPDRVPVRKQEGRSQAGA
jgi:[ribosomal protein S18]-alanine N-acetyltransferase